MDKKDGPSGEVRKTRSTLGVSIREGLQVNRSKRNRGNTFTVEE